MFHYHVTTHCTFCKRSCERSCDHCGRFVCSEHLLGLTQTPNTKIEFCTECQKRMKPGAVLGGVFLTKKMLMEEWNDVNIIET